MACTRTAASLKYFVSCVSGLAAADWASDAALFDEPTVVAVDAWDNAGDAFLVLLLLLMEFESAAATDIPGVIPREEPACEEATFFLSSAALDLGVAAKGTGLPDFDEEPKPGGGART